MDPDTPQNNEHTPAQKEGINLKHLCFFPQTECRESYKTSLLTGPSTARDFVWFSVIFPFVF